MDHKDYYKIMGLTKDATEKEIKAAYRKLARQYHPDLNKAADAEEKFKALGEAYEVLRDPAKRRQYDQYVSDWDLRQKAPGSGQGASFQFDDFLDSLFGGGGGAGPFRQQFRQDYKSTIQISLEDAYHGGTKDLKIDGNKPQTIRVNIPRGVMAGQQIRLKGQGIGGGDLYLTVNLAPHKSFEVKKRDIYLVLPVAPWEVALGATIAVPTLGGMVDLKIPAGSQGGQRLRLKGRGLPGTPAGDQYVILKIMIPQPTTDTGRNLYQKMAEEMAFNPRESMRG